MEARELARTMILDVLRTTGITATAGIGTNLYLCKVAMDIMGKHVAPNESGVRIAELDKMSYRRQLWMHRPLTDFWRVGKGYPILLGFCRKVKHPFPFWLVQLQQQGHPFQIFLRRSRAAVILNIAHIDWRQVQLCRHAAERQAARHTLLPKEAAKGLFHAFHLLVRSLDWEQCQYSKHLFDQQDKKAEVSPARNTSAESLQPCGHTAHFVQHLFGAEDSDLAAESEHPCKKWWTGRYLHDGLEMAVICCHR